MNQSQPIYVSNMGSNRAIVDALQRAMDVVVNRKVIEGFFAGGKSRSAYAEVFPPGRKQAIALAALSMSADLGGSSAIHLTILAQGYYGAAQPPYIPPALAERLVMRLDGTAHVSRFRLTGRSYVGHLLNVPTTSLRPRPHVTISAGL